MMRIDLPLSVRAQLTANRHGRRHGRFNIIQ
jgi:hypothetical protein